MTEEQIKQNADKYADKLYEDGRCTESTAPTIQEIYIAGAHSRDEEIEVLKSGYHDMFLTLAYKVEQLRNPWVNVNDKSNRPKKGEQIIIAFDDIEKYLLKYTDEDVFKIWNAHQWMPIPELPKGE